MPAPKGILWVDLETTGTDEDVDEIIEVGTVLTDFQFTELTMGANYVVKPSSKALLSLLHNPTVREMHEANGLLDQCQMTEYSIDMATTEIIRELEELGYGPKSVLLGGSEVSHFDKRFIVKYMPRLVPYLTRRTFDIGIIRLYLKTIGALEPTAGPSRVKNHRALDDIRMHVDEARQYKDMITPTTNLRDLIADFVDPGECRYDHHGYCQEHEWFETDPPCPHARAKKLFEVPDSFIPKPGDPVSKGQRIGTVSGGKSVHAHEFRGGGLGEVIGEEYHYGYTEEEGDRQSTAGEQEEEPDSQVGREEGSRES